MRSRWLVWFAAISGTTACAQSGEPAACAADAAAFSQVSDMLGAHCGSLDCHGQAGRPLRLYSGRGLRLSRDDVSGHGGTRNAEHAANLLAVTALEPELTCEVLAAAGDDPERLSLVRKATGAEHHVGGEVLGRKSPGRTCLLSWLAGQRDVTACELALESERPQ